MSNNTKYSFRWKNYEQNFLKSFFEFLEKKEFTDITLKADDCSIGAHRLVLAAISPYFHSMFSKSHHQIGKRRKITLI